MSYWKKFYNDGNLINSVDLQSNVGRTREGKAISQELWDSILKDIVELLKIEESKQDVLELCCGNGQIIAGIAEKCNRCVGVDFSEILLKQLKKSSGNQIETVLADINEIDFEPNSFDSIILYFSLQYFNEKEVIELIRNCLEWLKPKGKIFIGDIPNETKKWEYISLPEYRKDYVERVLRNEPLIGNWFDPNFFLAVNEVFTEVKVEVLDQPSYHFNSSYRFDVLISK